MRACEGAHVNALVHDVGAGPLCPPKPKGTVRRTGNYRFEDYCFPVRLAAGEGVGALEAISGCMRAFPSGLGTHGGVPLHHGRVWCGGRAKGPSGHRL